MLRNHFSAHVILVSTDGNFVTKAQLFKYTLDAVQILIETNVFGILNAFILLNLNNKVQSQCG